MSTKPVRPAVSVLMADGFLTWSDWIHRLACYFYIGWWVKENASFHLPHSQKWYQNHDPINALPLEVPEFHMQIKGSTLSVSPVSRATELVQAHYRLSFSSLYRYSLCLLGDNHVRSTCTLKATHPSFLGFRSMQALLKHHKDEEHLYVWTYVRTCVYVCPK